MAVDLIALAARLGQRLAQTNRRLATAESCTGGLIAATCTAIPGSSDWLDCGIVTYTVSAKVRWLGVEPQILARHGAVSEPTAAAMVLGLLARADADIGVSVTGIAGPTGGEPTVPVGTVWFGWGMRDSGAPRLVQASVHRFDGSRTEVRERAVQVALEGLLALAG